MARITLPRQVGIVVAKSRSARGLTQAQVAEKAGVSRQLVNRLEMGFANGIALSKLMAILEAVGCALDVYPLDGPDEFDIASQHAKPHAPQQDFDPYEEYPFDESLFDPNPEVSR